MPWPYTIPVTLDRLLTDQPVGGPEAIYATFREWCAAWGVALPFDLPEDLRRFLVDLQARRHSVAHQDIWAVLQDWLERHEVEAPDIPPNPAPHWD